MAAVEQLRARLGVVRELRPAEGDREAAGVVAERDEAPPHDVGDSLRDARGAARASSRARRSRSAGRRGARRCPRRGSGPSSERRRAYERRSASGGPGVVEHRAGDVEQHDRQGPRVARGPRELAVEQAVELGGTSSRPVWKRAWCRGCLALGDHGPQDQDKAAQDDQHREQQRGSKRLRPARSPCRAGSARAARSSAISTTWATLVRTGRKQTASTIRKRQTSIVAWLWTAPDGVGERADVQAPSGPAAVANAAGASGPTERRS